MQQFGEADFLVFLAPSYLQHRVFDCRENSLFANISILDILEIIPVHDILRLLRTILEKQ